MIPRITVLNVSPIGTRRTGAFVECADKNESGYRVVNWSEYPPSPRGDAVRELRLRTPLSMGSAARRFGVSVVQWSWLERGGVTLSDADWDRVESELRTLVMCLYCKHAEHGGLCDVVDPVYGSNRRCHCVSDNRAIVR